MLVFICQWIRMRDLLNIYQLVMAFYDRCQLLIKEPVTLLKELKVTKLSFS